MTELKEYILSNYPNKETYLKIKINQDPLNFYWFVLEDVYARGRYNSLMWFYNIYYRNTKIWWYRQLIGCQGFPLPPSMSWWMKLKQSSTMRRWWGCLQILPRKIQNWRAHCAGTSWKRDFVFMETNANLHTELRNSSAILKTTFPTKPNHVIRFWRRAIAPMGPDVISSIPSSPKPNQSMKVIAFWCMKLELTPKVQ